MLVPWLHLVIGSARAPVKLQPLITSAKVTFYPAFVEMKISASMLFSCACLFVCLFSATAHTAIFTKRHTHRHCSEKD